MPKIGELLLGRGLDPDLLRAVLDEQRQGTQPGLDYDTLAACLAGAPQPVILVDATGTALYRNAAAQPLVERWPDGTLPRRVHAAIASTRTLGAPRQSVPFEQDGRQYELTIHLPEVRGNVVALHFTPLSTELRGTAARALLQALEESTTDGILVVSSPRGGEGPRPVEYFNTRFCQIWDIPEDTAGGESDEQLIGRVLAGLEQGRRRLKDPAAFAARTNLIYALNGMTPEELAHAGAAGLTRQDLVEIVDERDEVCTLLARSHVCVKGEDGRSYWVWFFRDITSAGTVGTTSISANEFRRYYEVLSRSECAHLLVDEEDRVVSINPQFVRTWAVKPETPLHEHDRLLEAVAAQVESKTFLGQRKVRDVALTRLVRRDGIEVLHISWPATRSGQPHRKRLLPPWRSRKDGASAKGRLHLYVELPRKERD